eukprot:TRINITY_DN2335_c0_g2_i1.p1 TRINITY_DN2335_c0_g2~~TRINITY_DN2335_c0_g2_i1.p1  ORF type:complete len:168 (+),score=39.02 TRINITY_DN2335_c0_g2_i1:115-618(+)
MMKKTYQYSNPNKDQQKIIVVGVEGVGKSTLTFQFVESEFVEDYDPTIEDSFRKEVIIDQETCVLNILDSAGNEDSGYSRVRNYHLKSGIGYLVVFSITSRKSFEEVTRFRDRFFQHNQFCNVPMVIVGNKCDFEEEREVETSEGINLATKYHCPFYKTSTKRKSLM